jgi:hypothetical protein
VLFAETCFQPQSTNTRLQQNHLTNTKIPKDKLDLETIPKIRPFPINKCPYKCPCKCP